MQVLNQVILRLIQPGIIASFSLVFVSVIKELPATLLLRPAGFDTLSVRVWIETSEGYYTMAAPSALLIILISILPNSLDYEQILGEGHPWHLLNYKISANRL